MSGWQLIPFTMARAGASNHRLVADASTSTTQSTPPQDQKSSVRLVGIQMIEQPLHGGAHLVEGPRTDDGRPLRFDRGHAATGMGHHGTSPFGKADELGASVARILPTLQIAELLEVVDEL